MLMIDNVFFPFKVGIDGKENEFIEFISRAAFRHKAMYSALQKNKGDVFRQHNEESSD